MYTRNLIAHKGTDNQILFEFLNQDQKRIDITGKVFTFRLISADGENLLLEKDLVHVNSTQGQAKIVLTEAELDPFDAVLSSYSIEQVSDGNPYEPVFVDDNAGARGVIQVVDSVMPKFTKSSILTIPSHINTTYYSNTIITEEISFHSFQFLLDNYIGDVTIEGATDTDNLWYDISTTSIVVTDVQKFIHVSGYHPFIRIRFDDDVANTGSINEIKYR